MWYENKHLRAARAADRHAVIRAASHLRSAAPAPSGEAMLSRRHGRHGEARDERREHGAGGKLGGTHLDFSAGDGNHDEPRGRVKERVEEPRQKPGEPQRSLCGHGRTVKLLMFQTPVSGRGHKLLPVPISGTCGSNSSPSTNTSPMCQPQAFPRLRHEPLSPPHSCRGGIKPKPDQHRG